MDKFLLKPTVILILSVAFISCNQQSKKREAIKVNSPLNYLLTDKGDTTLVFIHGWCINQTYWNSQVNYFRDRYRILTLDLAGHGQSKLERTNWSVEAYADDVVQLLTELKLEKVILIAHSMSGNIALHVYDKMPDKIVGFVGVDNLQELGVERTKEEQEQIETYFEQMESDFPNQSREYALGNLFSASTTDSIKNRVINDFTATNPQMAVATLKSLQLEGAKEKMLAPKLKIPMLLVVSDVGRTPLVNEESLKKYCGAGYKVFTIKGTGHYPMIEASQEFNERLSEALKTVN